MNRHSGPEVVEYNRGTYDPHYPNQYPNQYPNHDISQPGIHHQTITTTEEHGYGHEHFRHSFQQPNPYWKADDLRGSNHHDRKAKYDKYGRRDYKYNFYSMIDEPWNRCCEVGTCGSFPGNECIAKKTPKRDWL